MWNWPAPVQISQISVREIVIADDPISPPQQLVRQHENPRKPAAPVTKMVVIRYPSSCALLQTENRFKTSFAGIAGTKLLQIGSGGRGTEPLPRIRLSITGVGTSECVPSTRFHPPLSVSLPLGFGAQSKTRHAEKISLFLHSSGVRQRSSVRRVQRQHLKVFARFEQKNMGPDSPPAMVRWTSTILQPRMHRARRRQRESAPAELQILPFA